MPTVLCGLSDELGPILQDQHDTIDVHVLDSRNIANQRFDSLDNITASISSDVSTVNSNVTFTRSSILDRLGSIPSPDNSLIDFLVRNFNALLASENDLATALQSVLTTLANVADDVTTILGRTATILTAIGSLSGQLTGVQTALHADHSGITADIAGLKADLDGFETTTATTLSLLVADLAPVVW